MPSHPDHVPPDDHTYMEIKDVASFGIWKWIGFAVGVACVGGVLVAVFMQFTQSLRVASVLVIFFIGFMWLMARMADGAFDRERR